MEPFQFFTSLLIPRDKPSYNQMQTSLHFACRNYRVDLIKDLTLKDSRTV